MEKIRILVIDDEKEIREFLQLFFEERDYAVEIAKDGVEGLEKYAPDRFDLILCDLLMPRMIGIEFLRRVKEMDPNQKVIMLTGVQDQTLVKKARDLGCLHYLVKPITLEDLEDKVKECLPA